MKEYCFGEHIQRNNRILARLKGIQESQHYHNSIFLQELERSIQLDYNNYLKIEDDYWKLRAKISWVQEADANTMFFHIMATNNRRRNKIIFFKDDQGNLIIDQVQLISHTKRFFFNSFTTSHDFTDWLNIRLDPPNYNKNDLKILDKPLMPIEITNVVFSFKPFKTPGPDSIYPFFYQKYWNIVGPSISMIPTFA